MMDRETVENLKINSLRHLASQLSLNTRGGRQTLADRVIDYYQSVSWAANVRLLERAVEDSRVEEGVELRGRDVGRLRGDMSVTGMQSDEGRSEGSEAELAGRAESSGSVRPTGVAGGGGLRRRWTYRRSTSRKL